MVGDIELDEDERTVLRLNPKFSVNQDLQEGGLEFEQELSYAKARMEIGKQIAEMVENPVELTEQEELLAEELEEKTRQTYDPETRTYNDQNRRVTDIQECSRVTLPRPLPTKQEAFIEIRRDVHSKIYREYRQEYCNKKGEQHTNLTEQEQRGLKKLQKRIKENNLVILKTDKSGKFATTNLENYLKMGQEHTDKDKIITRTEIREIETVLNCHCRAWCKIWRTGKNHGHTGRIMTSKTTTSNNVASLWLALKDHKSGDKTRGIATGCTSNSKGLSNSVSDILEAVANNERDPYEVVSSEDMLSRVHEANKKNLARRQEWSARRLEKILRECNSCGDRQSLIADCTSCQAGFKETEPSQGQEHDKNKMLGFWNKCAECDKCGPRVTARVETDCGQCGAPVSKRELERVLLGNDVVGLFPNIKSKNSARIVRGRVEESDIVFEGFDYKQGGRYIVINKHLTGDLQPIWNVLPWRRKVGGTAPGMTGRGINSEEDDPEIQWCYPRAQPTEMQKRQIVSRCCEIAVRVLFENFVYNFCTTWYQRTSGGPIGAS